MSQAEYLGSGEECGVLVYYLCWWLWRRGWPARGTGIWTGRRWGKFRFKKLYIQIQHLIPNTFHSIFQALWPCSCTRILVCLNNIIIINCLFSYLVRNNCIQLTTYQTEVLGPAEGSYLYNPQVQHDLHRSCQHFRLNPAWLS